MTIDPKAFIPIFFWSTFHVRKVNTITESGIVAAREISGNLKTMTTSALKLRLFIKLKLNESFAGWWWSQHSFDRRDANFYNYWLPFNIIFQRFSLQQSIPSPSITKFLRAISNRQWRGARLLLCGNENRSKLLFSANLIKLWTTIEHFQCCPCSNCSECDHH